MRIRHSRHVVRQGLFSVATPLGATLASGLSRRARRVAARAAALGALAVLAGCGQKGPLYLPPPPVPAAAPTPAPDEPADAKRRQERQP